MASIISAGTTDATSLNISGDKTGILQLASNNAVTAVTIDTSQNVGIGTTTPTEKLEIKSSTDLKARVYTTGTTLLTHAAVTLKTGSYEYLIQNLTTTAGSAGALRFYDGTAGAERMRISSAGYVAINNTNPVGLGQLEVQAPSTGAALWVQTGGTNSGYTIAEFRTGTNAPALQIYGDASSTFGGTISSNITPGKYTIDASNLGVGTSIANGGTVDFSAASGMLVVNNWTNGAVTIYICGGGATVNVSSVSGTVGTFSYQVSVNGYRWTNNYGSTATFGFFFVRTRSGA